MYESEIIGQVSEYKRSLFHWLTEVRQSFRVWKQCYRGHRHGWDVQTFHRLCDNKGPTITLVKLNNTVVGGFADKSWRHTKAAGLKCVFVYKVF